MQNYELVSHSSLDMYKFSTCGLFQIQSIIPRWEKKTFKKGINLMSMTLNNHELI
jgi:hypothetical protein